MTEILAFSGIIEPDKLWSKLNFQNLDAVRNLNASIPDTVAGLSNAAQNGYGGFGLIMPAKSAIIGSLIRDWGSVKYGPMLDLSSAKFRENIEQIKAERPIKSPAQLQEAIKQKRRELREPIPESVEEVYEDFKPLFEALKRPFDKEVFKRECNNFWDKYKSENTNFQTNVIIPLQQKINEILEKSEISEGNIADLKKELDNLFDVALRIKNKTDHYHLQHGVALYNEIHLPPLLPLMEGCFIINDSYATLNQLAVYKTIQDVREILFQSEEYHTQENFDALTPEQKKSFTTFFKTCWEGSQALTFPEYKEKIDIFFTNQTTYVEGIIDNLQEEKETLEKRQALKQYLTQADLTEEGQELWNLYRGNQEKIRQIQQTDRLISIYKDYIDRTKLPDLLKKPFEIYFLDSKSQELQTKESIPEKIQGLDNGKERIMLALHYVRLFDDLKVLRVIAIEDLKDLVRLVKNDYYKTEIITTALEKKLVQINVQYLKCLVDLVQYERNKTKIITTALKQELVQINGQDFKDLVRLVGDDWHKVDIITTALDKKLVQINGQYLKILVRLVGDDWHKADIIRTALEQKAITNLSFEDLKGLVGLVGDDRCKADIITTALDKKLVQINGQDFKDLVRLVGDDGLKTAISNLVKRYQKAPSDSPIPSKSASLYGRTISL